MAMDIEIVKDADAAAEHAAEIFVETANAAIAERGRFNVSLSGGSTPKKLYKLLATPQFFERLDAANIYLFFGDERNVPADDDRSNYRMVREAFIEPANFPAENVFRWLTESASPDETASKYQDTLKAEFELHGETHLPVFDLILLGLGDDCHTASLFPHSRAISEMERLATANFVDKFNEYRLTMTFPVINAARNVIFIATGKEKADAVFEVIKGDIDVISRPAQSVAPINGGLKWILDEAAAKRISR